MKYELTLHTKILGLTPRTWPVVHASEFSTNYYTMSYRLKAIDWYTNLIKEQIEKELESV